MRMKLLQPAPSPGKKAAIVLAVAVHLALAAFLFYGIRWQSRTQTAVEVELVRGEAAPPAPVAPPEETRVEPPPEPKVEPPPAPKAPAKPPEPEVRPTPPKPEIARKEKPKPVKEPPPKPRYDPLRQQLEEEIKQTAERKTAVAINQEQAALRAASLATQRQRAEQTWIDKIRGKIKGNIVRPGNASGNPEARFTVVLLPDGSLVGEPRMTKSTGNPALDAAIERAIKKSDPLPKPDDPAVFQRELSITFKPFED